MESHKEIRLGSFVLLNPIGYGGMGAVWRAVHAGTGAPVAIKVMTAKKSREASFRAAFRGEVQAVARLNHPGIVTVLDYGEITPTAAQQSEGRLLEGRPYLAMELISGGSLRDVPRPVTWDDLKHILISLLDALAHAHARGVIHRDIKPSNVLYNKTHSSNGQIKLSDFGIAHALFERAWSPSDDIDTPMGTPCYMPPEQFEGRWRDYGPWTDLYALGCLAFELATAAPPFEGTLREVALGHLRLPPPTLNPPVGYPARLRQWVQKLLEKDPGKRFERAADAAWALHDLSDKPSEKAGVATRRTRLPSRRSSDWEIRSPQVVTLTHQDVRLVTERPEVRPEADDDVFPLSSTFELHIGDLDDTIDDASQISHWPSPPLPTSWRRMERFGLPIRLAGTGLGLYGLRTIPLVDREDERNFIWSLFCSVVSTQKPQVLLLRGPAGSGKSRLVSWLTQRAHEVGGATVLTAYHSPVLGPNDGLPGMVARFYRCFGLPKPEVTLRLENTLRAERVKDEYEWRALAELVIHSSAGEPESTWNSIKLEQPAQRYVLIQRLLRRAVRKRPIIVWFDDVQWGSDCLGAAEFLLSRQLESSFPVLVLATARDEALAERDLESALISNLLGHESACQLDITPLSKTDHRTLVEELLGLEGPLANQVAERTAGNPLFAVQLVGDWVRRGVLEVGTKGFTLRRDEQVELPDDIHFVWRLRLERLIDEVTQLRPHVTETPNTRDTAFCALELASVLGQMVEPAEWAKVCELANVEIPLRLTEMLINSCLAKPTEEGGWFFVHGMLRESLERQAREHGRWEAHNAVCADFLEQSSKRDRMGVSERIGRHWVEAGQLEKALEPLRRAVRERIDTSDFMPARRLLDFREQVLKRLQPNEDTPQWCTNWLLRAVICRHEGQQDEHSDWASKAERLAARNSWAKIRAEALMRMGEAVYYCGNLKEGLETVKKARDLARQSDARWVEGRCCYILGGITRDLGLWHESASDYQLGLDLAKTSGDDELLARCLAGIASVCDWLEQEAHDRVELYRRALEIFQQLGNQIGVGLCLNGLAEVARKDGRLAEAEDGYRKAVAVFEAVGSTNKFPPTLNLGMVFLARAEYQKARTLFETLNQELERHAERGAMPEVSLALCCCAAFDKRWNAWDRLFNDALSLLNGSGFISRDISWLALLAGDLALGSGEMRRAQGAYHVALSQLKAAQNTAEFRAVEQRLKAVDSGTKTD